MSLSQLMIPASVVFCDLIVDVVSFVGIQCQVNITCRVQISRVVDGIVACSLSNICMKSGMVKNLEVLA